jgi:hypothetical protein
MPLAAAWSSAEDPHSQSHLLPSHGHYLILRARCTGAGQLQVHVRGSSFDQVTTVPCDGGWRVSHGFPVIGEVDPGPYPVDIDVTDPVSSWSVEVRASVATQPPAPATPAPSPS